jgi:hypothetical protein
MSSYRRSICVGILESPAAVLLLLLLLLSAKCRE